MFGSVKPYIKLAAVSVYHTDGLLREGTTVYATSVNENAASCQSFKYISQSVFLMKAHIRICVTVFNTNQHLADGCYSGKVATFLLIGVFCVIFFRRNKFMIEIQVVFVRSVVTYPKVDRSISRMC